MSLILTGVGSRTTPPDIIEEMITIGEWASKNKHWIRSGHADGADFAFERGCCERTVVYLPWNGFNADLEDQYGVTTNAQTMIISPEQKYLDIVKQVHPAFEKLSRGALALHCRNVPQVLGADLDNPSDAVVCYTSAGLKKGGTATAISIAEMNNIPVFNMGLDKYSTATKVVACLEAL